MDKSILKSVGIETLIVTLLASVLSAVASYISSGDAFSWGGLVAVVVAALSSGLTSYLRATYGALVIPVAKEIPPATEAQPQETK